VHIHRDAQSSQLVRESARERIGEILEPGFARARGDAAEDRHERRRAVVQSPAITAKWGAGWFVLPNPVYGTALKGSRDEVFPPAIHWAPTQGIH
jgi:hypothetical protein